MAYATGPYAHPTALPPPPRPEIHSARSIDFARRLFEFDDTTGGFLGMRPVAQRVVLLAARAASLDRPFNTVQDRNAIVAAIRAALAMLEKGSMPVAKILEVEAGSTTAGQSYIQVTFQDLTTGTKQSVQL